MASVFKVKKTGYYRAQFKNRFTGKQDGFQIGRLSAAEAKEFDLHLNRLERASLNGLPVPDECSKWLSRMMPSLRERLQKKGLIDRTEELPRTFAALCAYTIEQAASGDSGNKQGTQANKVNSLRHAISFFEGVDVETDLADWKRISSRAIGTITTEDVKRFRQSLRGRRDKKAMSENSKVGVMKNLNEVFNLAVKHGLLASSPGKELKGSWLRSEKLEYVPLARFRELYDRADEEWRLILGLAMFAGLRSPSEVNALRWQDIDFKNRSMLVRSSKLGRNGVKYVERVVPIFDELAEPLVTMWTRAGEPARGDVITQHRTPENERGQYDGYALPAYRLAEQVGVDCWLRPMQNLRASFISRKLCGLEGTKAEPQDVICKWVGQSSLVAGKHYVMLSDEKLTGASNWQLDEVKQKVKYDQRTGPARDKKAKLETAGFQAPVASAIPRDSEASTPDRIRTCDLRFRKPSLYPTELRGQNP